MRSCKISSRKPFIIGFFLQHNIPTSFSHLSNTNDLNLPRTLSSTMQFTALTLLLRLGLGVSSLAIYPPNRNETNFIENRGGTRTDPSGQTSQWTKRQNDGTGRYVGTCGDSGKGNSHCWADVYAVQYQTPWQPWEAVSRGFTRSDQPCSTTHINAKQACISQETSTSFSVGIDDEVLKIGAEVSHTEGSSQCTTSQNNYQCSCMSPSSAF
jgi:hypothetical protein